MSYLDITTNAFKGNLTIWGIRDEDPLVDRLTYVTFEAYKGVCKKYKKSDPDYMEHRAYYIGHLLRDILEWWGYKVKDISEGDPITCKAIIDESKEITCKVEFGTHRYFLENFISQEKDTKDLNINWGFCNATWKTSKRTWPLRDKLLSMDITIGVKLTDPIKEEPVEKEFIFDAAIHETIHLIDDIRKYYSKRLAFKIAEPLLKKILTKFFVFERTENK